MRRNSICYVENPRLGASGVKNDAQNLIGLLIFSGVILKLPHKIVFELIG